jgi:tripartite-type tricarboxylate transporter receptor subunit TctC
MLAVTTVVDTAAAGRSPVAGATDEPGGRRQEGVLQPSATNRHGLPIRRDTMRRRNALTSSRASRRLALTPVVALVAVACAGDAPSDEPATADEGQVDEVDHHFEYFMTPYAPGGAGDLSARAFVEAYEEHTGATVTVDNIDGGGGTIGVADLITSGPQDGSTIGNAANTALAFQPLANPDLPYESVDDYTVFGAMGSTPPILIVAPDSEWGSFDQMITFVENDPGGISIGTTGARTLSDLNTEEINMEADAEFNTVHLEGASEGVAQVVGGHIDGFITTYPTIRGFLEDGEIEALVVLDDEEYPPLPDIPIITDYGLDPPLALQFYVIGPPDLEPAIEAAIERDVVAVLESEAYQEWQRDNGMVPEPGGSEVGRESLASNESTFARILESMEERGRL